MPERPLNAASYQLDMPVKIGDYFTLVGRDGEGFYVWRFDGTSAQRIDDVTDTTFVSLAEGESLSEAMARRFGALTKRKGAGVVRMELRPGEYYPRIARPLLEESRTPGVPPEALPEARERYAEEIAKTREQLAVLAGRLREVCRVVQPHAETLSAYGPEIRNLLLLACMEMETGCRAVLKANGRAKAGDRYTTKDYVLLEPAMRLSEYAIRFSRYPWLDARRPFKGWDRQSPTESLPWLKAYNAVKHDRESNLSKGTLAHAFDAIAACAILAFAQFGAPLVFGWSGELNEALDLAGGPSWPFTSNYVAPYRERDGRMAVNYPFDSGETGQAPPAS